MQQAHALQQSLRDTAQQHQAFIGKTCNPALQAQPEDALARPIASLEQVDAGGGSPAGGGDGNVPAFGRPDLVISAPAGIALLTAQDSHAAASTVTLTGGLDVSITAGRNLAAAARSGISLFSYGDAKASRKAQGDKGIKLHAAQGKVDVQAQSGELKAAAEQDVHITSTHAKVEVAAKEHVLLTAGGAYLKIANGNIEIHAPGQVQFKAAMKVLGGPTSLTHALAKLPEKQGIFNEAFIVRDEKTREPMPNVPYRIESESGGALEGRTNAEGRTERFFSKKKEKLKLFLLDD